MARTNTFHWGAGSATKESQMLAPANHTENNKSSLLNEARG